MPNSRDQQEEIDDILSNFERLSIIGLRRKLKSIPHESLSTYWNEAPPELRRKMSHALDSETVDRLRKEQRTYKAYPKNQSEGATAEEEPRTSEKDYLEYQLSRIHRERVEDELDKIRGNIKQHFKSSKKRSRKRRRENVYVLVALGIISGFVSYSSSLQNSNSPFKLVATASAIASAFFLFIKLNTVGRDGENTSKVSKSLDKLSDIAFRIAASGAFVIGVSAILFTVFRTQLTNVSTNIAQIIIIIFTILSSTLSVLDKFSRSSSEPISFNQVQDAMFSLASEEGDIQDETEFLEMLDEYKTQVNTEDNLIEVKKRASQIEGLTDSEAEKIDNHLDNLIDEKSKENKTEEEIREMRIAERDEERESYRERVQELMEESD